MSGLYPGDSKFEAESLDDSSGDYSKFTDWIYSFNK
jgi:hypothetical protein